VIKRNIEKASSAQTAAFKESMFEFIGPGGTYILVNVLTDNDNRASSEVALVGKKQSLKSGSKGSVAFNFVKKARLDTDMISEDKLMELCLECGVDDYELRTTVDGNQLNPSEENKAAIYVDLLDMGAMRDALRAAGFAVETSIRHVPKDSFVALGDSDFEALMTAVDAFLALDDVDSVEHNVDMAEDD
jgi:transcriptional/translational regulatory protein YebC/TACO1